MKARERKSAARKSESATDRAVADAIRKFVASYKGGVPTRLSERWSPRLGYQFGTATDRRLAASARDRGYQAYRNNPVAQTLVRTETDNVIGDGLNYQPESDNQAWNREAEDRYYEWLEDCTVRGASFISGCEVQRMIWEQSRVAGDIGWVLTKQDDAASGTIISRIQIIPSENICTPDASNRDRDIVEGIQFDSMGKPKRFFVLSQDESGKRDWATVDERDFVFFPHNIEPQSARGVTCYQPIFDLLAHLDRYIDGVSLAAWMATVMGIIFKQNSPGKSMRGLGLTQNSEGQQQRAITFENGMVKFIGADEDVVQVQAHQPMQQTPEFIRAMYRMLGQPFDMPLEVLAKDMSTCTFASARIGLLPFYRSCRIKAARFASRWSRTIRWWLSRERQRRNDDPKKWKTPFPENFWSHSLLPNSWEYTDPVSEAQADLLQVDMGTKSTQMVIAERGRSAEKILRESAEWDRKMRELGLQRINSSLTRHPQLGVGAQGDPEGWKSTESTTAPGTNGNSANGEMNHDAEVVRD